MSPKTSAEKQTRVKWCDEKTGTDIIADFVGGVWQFSEREYGGVKWYDIKEPTPEMLEKRASLFQNQNAA